jgi:hypothetical protein
MNFVFGPYMMISIGRNGDGNLTSFCNPYVGYYPNLKNIVSFTTMDEISSDSNFSMMKNTFTTTTDGKWINLRCAANLVTLKAWSEIAHAETISNVNKDLNKPSYFKDQSFDFLFSFHNFSKNGNLAKFSIINSSSITSLVYINYIQIWKTYLSADIKHQYYDFSQSLIGDYPGLDAIINIQHLTSKTIIGLSRGEDSSKQFAFTKIGSDKRAPDSFYRLILSNPNTFYKYSTFDNTFISNLTCPEGTTCYKNNKILTCPDGSFYKVDGGTISCDSTCAAKTIPQYGIADTNGFCIHPCETGNFAAVKCPTTITEINTNFECISNYTRVFFDCIPDANLNKGAIFIGGTFNGPFIDFLLQSKFKVEFWYFPDRIFVDTSSNETNHYVFETGSVSLIRPKITLYKMAIN